MEYINYIQEKRKEVLDSIKDICNAFSISCDYIISDDGRTETLILNGQKIGCTSNSISAVVDEVIGYIFIKIYCKHRYIGAFETQTKNVIKKYWID